MFVPIESPYATSFPISETYQFNAALHRVQIIVK